MLDSNQPTVKRDQHTPYKFSHRPSNPYRCVKKGNTCNASELSTKTWSD